MTISTVAIALLAVLVVGPHVRRPWELLQTAACIDRVQGGIRDLEITVSNARDPATARALVVDAVTRASTSGTVAAARRLCEEVCSFDFVHDGARHSLCLDPRRFRSLTWTEFASMLHPASMLYVTAALERQMIVRYIHDAMASISAHFPLPGMQ